jgi:hypothetical protein
VRRGAEHAKRLLQSIAAELFIVAIAGAVYVVVRKFTEGSPQIALDNARQLVHVERILSLNHEQSFQELVLTHSWIRDAANWMYIWGHWPVIAVVATGLWFSRHGAYVRLRNAVFVSGMIGFLFFALVPMAPPRLTSFGFVDTVTVWSGSYRVLQPPQYTNIYAAMPSLHFGWDLLVGVTLFLSSSVLVLRIIGLMMPLAMWFAVVATGNHWILDTIVGLCVVVIGAAISESATTGFAMYRQRRNRPAPVKHGVPIAPARSTAGALVDGPKRVPTYHEPTN